MTAQPRFTIAAAQARLARDGSCVALTRDLLARASDRSAHAVYTHLDAAAVLKQAQAADVMPAAASRDGMTLRGVPLCGAPLCGVPISIKDLFDVAGEVTTAGSTVRRNDVPALRDAPVVSRLKAAGAVLLGRTNMSEFAFSGVGINPHHGTPRNPCDNALHRIPGGSSSGAAASVALGLAVAGLGSDTGGSLRIPAALCGLVGFKPTQSRVPREGAFELARSLDTVGAITHNVTDALTLDACIADTPLNVQRVDVRNLRFALPQTVVLDALEPAVAQAYEHALRRLRDAGATLVELPLHEFAEVARLNTPGGISGTEAFAVHRALVDSHRAQFDPRVALRIETGRAVTAADYIGLLDRRRDWITRVTPQLEAFDAFLAPTVPMVAPPLQPLIDSDEAFFTTNTRLLRNPALVNYLDGCAFSLPCHADGDMPVGLMVASSRGRDAHLAAVALAVEAALLAA